MSFKKAVPDNWQLVALKDIQLNEPRATVTGPFGSSIGKRFFVNEGVPVIRGNNLSYKVGTFNDTEFVYVTHEKADELKGYIAKPGDLIFTAAGTIGQVALIPTSARFERYIISNKQMRARLDPNKVDIFYAYYWFSSPLMNGYIKRQDTGSTIPLINLSVLRALPILLPPLRDQTVIASILKSLDDKIDINHKINQTLEQMAQAIFKSWFVDFEPVKAKIAALEAGGNEEDALFAAMQAISGKSANELARLQTENREQYAELRSTAELFPSAMQDSELGEIPEGWSVGTLADVANLNQQSWTKRTIPSEIRYVDLANTKNGVIESTTTYQADNAPSRARRILSDGDTIVGTVRPGNRSFALIKRPQKTLTGSTGFAVLSPKRAELAEFVYITATLDEAINHLAHLADGGAYPAVRPEVVINLHCIVPTERLIAYFHKTVRPFFEQAAVNKLESSTLSDLRDSLLPKLLSGELSVAAVEEQLAQATEPAHV